MRKTVKKPSGRIVIMAMTVFLVAAMLGYLSLINQIHIQHTSNTHSIFESGDGVASEDTRQLQEQIDYLKTKLDSYMAYGKDPFLSQKSPAKCKHQMNVKQIACPEDKSCAVDDSDICLDDFPFKIDDNQNPKKDCVMYDFGIRESPQFGLAFAKQCDVVGFDPSPISIKWWKKEHKTIQKEYPKYSFCPVGAGGIDGDIELREYDWGQVSIIEFPKLVINTTDCNIWGACRYTKYKQHSFDIPVRTLKTVMSEHQHSRVHLLKLDVEGSEYAFLETMIDDLSCRKVDQLVLEWHHYDYDIRYGVTSNPQINVMVALLKERCGLEQFWIDGSNGWPSNSKLYHEMGMTLYYSLSAFKRTRWNF